MDVSTLLENQALALREMQNVLRETTNTSDVAVFNKIAFPLVRRVYGGLIAKEIVSVQPMSAPQTLVFYMDFKYVNSSGTTTGYPYGHLESNAFNAAAFNRDYSAYKSTGAGVLSGSMVTDANNGQQYLALSACTLTGQLEWGSTVKVYTATTTAWADVVWNYGSVTQPNPYGAPTEYMGSFYNDRLYLKRGINSSNTELTGSTLAAALTGVAVTFQWYQRATKNSSEDTSTIAELSVEMKSKPVEAKSRKLKVQWTTEIEQDAKAYHGLDIEKTLTDFLSEHITLEIDREIINDLFTGYARENAAT